MLNPLGNGNRERGSLSCCSRLVEHLIASLRYQLKGKKEVRPAEEPRAGYLASRNFIFLESQIKCMKS